MKEYIKLREFIAPGKVRTIIPDDDLLGLEYRKADSPVTIQDDNHYRTMMVSREAFRLIVDIMS